MLPFFPSCFVFVFKNSFEIAVNELNALSNFYSFNYGGRGNTSGNTNVKHHRETSFRTINKVVRPQNHIRDKLLSTNSQGITVSNIDLPVKVSSASCVSRALLMASTAAARLSSVRNLLRLL